MEALDVLVIESHDGTADRQSDALTAAGHRVHRCTKRGTNAFPCTEITEPGSCPIDHGVDVALLVRRNVALRPVDREQGVSCAIRTGVPVVEDGPSVLDPFEPYVAARVTGDLVETCEDAAAHAHDGLRDVVVERCATALTAAGVGADTDIEFERVGRRLVVTIRGARVSRALQDSLAVAVVAAINDGQRAYDGVDVRYHARSPEAG